MNNVCTRVGESRERPSVVWGARLPLLAPETPRGNRGCWKSPWATARCLVLCKSCEHVLWSSGIYNTRDTCVSVTVSRGPLLAIEQRTHGAGRSTVLLSSRESILGGNRVGKEMMRTGWVVVVRDTACQGEGPRHGGAEVAFMMAGWGREGEGAADPLPAPALVRRGQQWWGSDLAACISFVERRVAHS